MRKISLILCLAGIVSPSVSMGAGETDTQKSAKAAFLRFKERQYVEIDKMNGVVDLQQPFTIEAWFRIGADNGKFMYIAGDEAWKGMHKDVVVEIPCGWVIRATELKDEKRRLEFTIAAANAIGSANWLKVTTSSHDFSDPKKWHNVAVCRTPESIKLYLNGRLEMVRPCAKTTFVPSPTNVFLGPRKSAFPDRQLFGDIGGFRMSSGARYVKAFTPAESFEADNQTLVVLDFRSPKKPQLRDLTGREHHGSIVGPIWLEELKQARSVTQPTVEQLQTELDELRIRLAIMEQRLEELAKKTGRK